MGKRVLLAASTAMRVVEEERPLTLPKGPNFARKKKVGKYDFYTYTKNHTYYKAKIHLQKVKHEFIFLWKQQLCSETSSLMHNLRLNVLA